MRVRKNPIIFAFLLLVVWSLAYAQTYGTAAKKPTLKRERRYYGTVLQYSDKLIVIRREVTNHIRERLNFRIDENTEITGNISIGSKVAVEFKILYNNHRKRLALKIYPVQALPKY